MTTLLYFAGHTIWYINTDNIVALMDKFTHPLFYFMQQAARNYTWRD
ncbi:hypothetical protein SPIRO4BDMA_40780 [uncultured spirochete]|uniref:Uncharacterized protein n=1 Tax=uncultured spirochete TaxID=156406 RepID=A0A3P3XPK2_9SPIR|nr:hypothetical protein SPIRO4BDMA_40780 [uncultured spirochete]